MSQIDELQSRMTRALDRISKGVEALEAPQPALEPVDDGSAEEIARLNAALEDEKMANAQLEARVRSLHDQLEAQPEAPEPAEPDAALQEQIAAQREGMQALDGELQRLRQANDALLKSCTEMREALAENLGEPHLINQAMLAELEALRAARAAEAAEARAVLGALEPMLAQAAGEEEAAQ
ncbi:hypothetical protein KUV62_18245 [Salipiger bermudensis]|uniref:hypothetical protein n=1 Tax=Salipiger bermudensis TaxID=344736 RepID=UPI001C995879|nr:hypothetical protein [Salipiger bermudensis]MBY6005867.1 hypothetical protein [Salipiger bermudensis]